MNYAVSIFKNQYSVKHTVPESQMFSKYWVSILIVPKKGDYNTCIDAHPLFVIYPFIQM